MSAQTAKQTREERIEEIRQQPANGELVIRRMTAAERERYGPARVQHVAPPRVQNVGLPRLPEPETVACEYCGKPHDPTPRSPGKPPRRFCSRRCAALGAAKEREA
jgi:hypothetical protein